MYHVMQIRADNYGSQWEIEEPVSARYPSPTYGTAGSEKVTTSRVYMFKTKVEAAAFAAQLILEHWGNELTEHSAKAVGVKLMQAEAMKRAAL